MSNSTSGTQSGSDDSRSPSSSDTGETSQSESSKANFLPSPFYPSTLAKIEGEKELHTTPDLPEEYPPLPTKARASQVDEKDKGTPDEWVVRDERLVRLTGKWPLNCEAPLPELWNAGFLTPSPLFYVRNHGVVPKVSQADAAAWTLDISGLVANPVTLTLSDLLNPTLFNPITLPVTLVCAGNRRKEQNMVRKSLGFSWGPAGLSTALFTGVYLADVLDLVKPKNIGTMGQDGFRRAEHVIFEGAEDLPNGKYGTSQRLRWARQREKGMMLAWAMNGQALEPDHGYPLRLVVPGQIGGRSVKWLKKIEISDKESQHHLHFWDNKVLPSTLMPEQARSEREWWYDPRYIINDLNTNSAIARPAHDEKLVVERSKEDDGHASSVGVDSGDGATPEKESSATMFSIQGYAYAGGGRRVNRVEITLDAGVSWILANVVYPEDSYRTKAFNGPVWGSLDLTERDECFCWAFWKIDVDVNKLVDAGSIAVRASDESLNLQGQTMYWNPTGMMNNWWFRVAIHKSTNDSGDTVITFEHPTMPGLQPGGWMERLKELGEDILNPIFTAAASAEDGEIQQLAKESAKAKKVAVVMTKDGVDRKITMAEVKAHNKESEPWFIVNGEVYDGTQFLGKHPGGSESITLVAGEDASDDFMAIHSSDAKVQLRDFHIGTLVASEGEAVPSAVDDANKEPDPIFLQKTKWKSAKLIEVDYLNHDSRLYRFQLEHPEQPLGLPTGQHVYARLRRKVSPGDAESEKVAVEGEMVQRAYTPVSLSDAKGVIELLIKVYHRTAAFPEGGKMTLGFEELKVGECVEFKGPLGSFEWLGKGLAKWRGIERKASKIGMICGGSGITPILQVLRGVIDDPYDNDTQVWVINANKTEADILMRAELEALSEKAGPDRCKQHLVLSKASEEWQFSRGRINKNMLSQHLPPPGDDALVLICGPDPMINEIVKPGLTELGWDVPNQLVVF